jgi:hypothetical protein
MTAIGFRVKSGYAIAVVLAGTKSHPRAVARHVVALSDPKVAETRQPYHDRFFKTEEDAAEIVRRVRIVKRCAKSSVSALVVGSLIDPATVGNPHIRAHAFEGQLFRTVLEAALRARGLACEVVVDKHLPARAKSDLGAAAVVARAMSDFGETLGRPWRADEKAAATAAWLALGA